MKRSLLVALAVVCLACAVPSVSEAGCCRRPVARAVLLPLRAGKAVVRVVRERERFRPLARLVEAVRD